MEKVRALHVKEAQFLSQLEELYPPETQPAADPVQQKADEIDDNVQRLLAQAMEAATAENLRAKAAEEDEEEPDLSDTAEFIPGAPQEDDYDEDDARDYQEGSRQDDEDDDDDHRPDRGGRIDFGSLQFGRDYEIT